jgi:hypothetical protein
MKRIADKGLQTGVCQHINTVTPVLQTSHRNRAGKVSFVLSPLHPYWLQAQTASYRSGYFGGGGSISLIMKLKKFSSEILRMGEVSLNVAWH